MNEIIKLAADYVGEFHPIQNLEDSRRLADAIGNAVLLGRALAKEAAQSSGSMLPSAEPKGGLTVPTPSPNVGDIRKRLQQTFQPPAQMGAPRPAPPSIGLPKTSSDKLAALKAAMKKTCGCVGKKKCAKCAPKC